MLALIGARILFSPIIIILVLVFLFRRGEEKQLRYSKEEELSEVLLFLSVVFLMSVIYSLNSRVDQLVPWRHLLLLSSTIMFALAYWKRLRVNLVFGLLSIISWWLAESYHWIDASSIKGIVLFSGLFSWSILLYVAGRWQQMTRYKVFSDIYIFMGLVSSTAILFVLSSGYWIQSAQAMFKGENITKSPAAMTLLVLVGGIVIWGLIYTASKKALLQQEISLISILLLAVYMLTIFGSFNSLMALVFNILLFVEIFGIIYLGYTIKEESFVNFGTVFLFIAIVVKYFDWFFSFLDKSVFFIGAGIILFLVGWTMDKGRKYIISDMNSHEK